MPADPDGEPASGLPRTLSPSRHLLGFVASGLIAFSVDALVLLAATHLLAVDPRMARFAAIAVAMVAGWLAHRRLTFAVAARPTLAELGRYAAAGWTAAALNYAVFAGLITLRPGVAPLAALLASTAVATIFSYCAMRWVVFRKPG